MSGDPLAWLDDELARPHPPGEWVRVLNVRDGESLVSPFNLRFGVEGYGVCAPGQTADRSGHFVLDVMQDGRRVKLYQSEKAYHLPEVVTKKDPNGIRIGKTILQHEITTDQALKLVSTGKTDVIKGFVSNRTKRKFDAFLTFDPKDGKIGFESPPRPAKKAAAKKAAKSEE